MKNGTTMFGSLVMLAFVLSAGFCLWNPPVRVTNLEEPPPVVTVAVPPPAPLCTHEVCGQRPTRLKCSYWKATSVMHGVDPCAIWDIEYEHHCDCDAWGPAP